ncbi:MAG: RDD family protein [Bacilli bacterium]
MKASFFKRMGAFVIDYFIVLVIASLITMGFNTNKNNDLNSQMNQLISDYQNEKITIDEYKDETYKLNYELQKENMTVNIVTITLYIGYFVVFATLNKGQTLGKKLLKIRVVNKNNDKPSIWNMLVRSLFIYNIISILFSTVAVNFLNINTFTYIYTTLGYIEYFVIIISFFMVIYKKDGRGLHDMMAGTNVIEEVKK